MFSLFALLLFCFMSVGRSFPVCEKLVGPADQLDPGHFEGAWAFVAGSLSHEASMQALSLRDSITAYFSNFSDSLTYTQINRFGDQCQSLPYNISAEGTTFTFDVGNRFSLNASFLYTTCPDCVVMRWVVMSKRRVSVDLYLLSRRRQLGHEEMAEFEAQLRCFQLPPPVVMDPTKELCPEPQENRQSVPSDTEAETTELKP